MAPGRAVRRELFAEVDIESAVVMLGNQPWLGQSKNIPEREN